MTYSAPALSDTRLIVPPKVNDPQRLERLRQLRVTAHPDFDEFARELAGQLGTTDPANAVVLVNIIDSESQHVVGRSRADMPWRSTPTPLPRQADLGLGFCPYVVERRSALPLDHVLDYPRYAGNPMVQLEVESYLGAPLLDRSTVPGGVALGTVCLFHPEPQRWDRGDVAKIKQAADEVVQIIHSHAAQAEPPRHFR